MPEFHYQCPIQLRYADLDAQQHVNNASYLSFLEQARVAYMLDLGLWSGNSFQDLGLIVGDIHIRYIAPVELHHKIRVDICTTRIGNKSLTFAYQIVNTENNMVMATAESIMVAYNYRMQSSVPVSWEWREKIGAFEGKNFHQPAENNSEQSSNS